MIDLLLAGAGWIAVGLCGVVNWKMGDYLWWAPWLGVLAQVFWIIVAIQTAQLPLGVACILYGASYLRTAWKWTRERQLSRSTGRRPALD